MNVDSDIRRPVTCVLPFFALMFVTLQIRVCAAFALVLCKQGQVLFCVC